MRTTLFPFPTKKIWLVGSYSTPSMAVKDCACDRLALNAKKIFHVSPFCAVEGGYHFRFMSAQQQIEQQVIHRITARIDYEDAQGLLLLTSISGKVQPITDSKLLFAFLRYPLLTFGVIFRIHWQAVKLFIKGVPFFKKPLPPSSELSR
jgi:DUF1365 family protein